MAELAFGEGLEPHVGERPRHALRVGGVRRFPEAECANRPSNTVSRSDALGRRVRILRQEPQARGDLTARQSRDVAAFEPHLAGAGRAQSGQRAQQQRLARAIAAQQRDELPGADRAVRSSTSIRPGTATRSCAASSNARSLAQPADFERAWLRPPRPRRATPASRSAARRRATVRP